MRKCFEIKSLFFSVCVFRGLWRRSTGREPCSSDIKRAIRLPAGPFIVPPHSTAAPLTHHLLPPASLVLISVSECGRTTEARKIKRHRSKFVCISSSFTAQVPPFIQPNTQELFELFIFPQNISSVNIIPSAPQPGKRRVLRQTQWRSYI